MDVPRILVRLTMPCAAALVLGDAVRLLILVWDRGPFSDMFAYFFVDAGVLALIICSVIMRRFGGRAVEAWLAAALSVAWLSALWRGLFAGVQPALPFWGAVVLSIGALLQVADRKAAERRPLPRRGGALPAAAVMLGLALLFYGLTAVPLLFVSWFFVGFEEEPVRVVAITALVCAYGSSLGWVLMHLQPAPNRHGKRWSAASGLVSGVALALVSLWYASPLVAPATLSLLCLATGAIVSGRVARGRPRHHGPRRSAGPRATPPADGNMVPYDVER